MSNLISPSQFINVKNEDGLSEEEKAQPKFSLALEEFTGADMSYSVDSLVAK